MEERNMRENRNYGNNRRFENGGNNGNGNNNYQPRPQVQVQQEPVNPEPQEEPQVVIPEVVDNGGGGRISSAFKSIDKKSCLIGAALGAGGLTVLCISGKYAKKGIKKGWRGVKNFFSRKKDQEDKDPEFEEAK